MWGRRCSSQRQSRFVLPEAVGHLAEVRTYVAALRALILEDRGH